MLIGPRAVQDGLGIVLVRSFFRFVFRDRFFGRVGFLLGSFLAAPGVVLVVFRFFNSSIQLVNSSTRRFNSSTHQLMAFRPLLMIDRCLQHLVLWAHFSDEAAPPPERANWPAHALNNTHALDRSRAFSSFLDEALWHLLSCL